MSDVSGGWRKEKERRVFMSFHLACFKECHLQWTRLSFCLRCINLIANFMKSKQRWTKGIVGVIILYGSRLSGFWYCCTVTHLDSSAPQSSRKKGLTCCLLIYDSIFFVLLWYSSRCVIVVFLLHRWFECAIQLSFKRNDSFPQKSREFCLQLWPHNSLWCKNIWLMPISPNSTCLFMHKNHKKHSSFLKYEKQRLEKFVAEGT